MATASKAGRKRGKMNPPIWLAAKVTPPALETSMRWVADSLVQTISAPAAAQICSAASGHGHGQGHLGPGRGGDDQFEQQEQGLVVGEDTALPVDQGDVLATGVDDGPHVGPRGPHQVGDPGGRGGAVVATPRRRWRRRG